MASLDGQDEAVTRDASAREVDEGIAWASLELDLALDREVGEEENQQVDTCTSCRCLQTSAMVNTRTSALGRAHRWSVVRWSSRTSRIHGSSPCFFVSSLPLLFPCRLFGLSLCFSLFSLLFLLFNLCFLFCESLDSLFRLTTLLCNLGFSGSCVRLGSCRASRCRRRRGSLRSTPRTPSVGAQGSFVGAIGKSSVGSRW